MTRQSSCNSVCCDCCNTILFLKVGIDREHVGGWCIDLDVSRYIWYSAAVVYFLFLDVYDVNIGFYLGLIGVEGMGWDGMG